MRRTNKKKLPIREPQLVISAEEWFPTWLPEIVLRIPRPPRLHRRQAVSQGRAGSALTRLRFVSDQMLGGLRAIRLPCLGRHAVSGNREPWQLYLSIYALFH